MDVLPGFDVAEQIDASDGDKGTAKSFDNKMTNAQRVRDFLHVVNYLKEKVKVCEGGGKNAAAKYKEAFECKTMQQLKDFIEQLPPKIKLRFSNMDPATFFPCASTNGTWRGRMGSSFVESGNHALGRRTCLPDDSPAT